MLAPGDAYRKEQKKKELAKNKKVRKEIRDESLQTTDVPSLEAELVKLENQKKMGFGSNEKNQRIKQVEDAIVWHEEQRKKNATKVAAPAPVLPKVKNFGALQATGKELAVSSTQLRTGLGERRPQDSVYYHPSLNPTGRAPPGKPQKYKAVVDREEEVAPEEEDDDEEVPETGFELILPPPPGPPPGTVQAEAEESAPPPPPPPPPGPPPGRALHQSTFQLNISTFSWDIFWGLFQSQNPTKRIRLS